MSYSSFNGWTIIPPPTSPVPMQIDKTEVDAIAQVQSPFTLASQYQVWPGAEVMMWNVSLPPMRFTAAAAWTAWTKSLQGVLNVFQYGDPLYATAQGLVSAGSGTVGTPVVDGTSSGYNNPASYFLYTKSWTPNKTNVFLPGDYLQIGYRLHTVLQAVSSDSSGNATINIWPSIREQPTDGQAIVTSGCQGLWRLSENKREHTIRSSKLVNFSFKCVEAR